MMRFPALLCLLALLSLLALLCLLASPEATAQDRYVAMSVKGKVASSTDRGASWKKLSVGQTLGGSTLVRTSYASYVKFLMNGERLVCIDAKSSKRLSALGGKKGASGSVSSPVLLLASNAMQKATQKKSTSVPGGVRMLRNTASLFSAVFPRYGIMTSAPLFRWIDESGGRSYVLVIRDSAFIIVARDTVAGHSFDNSGTPLPLRPGCTYYWQVARTDSALASNIATFTVLAPDSTKAVRAELARLDAELRAMKADDVVTHLARALYFERKSLYTDAFREYREAIALRPDTEEYRAMLKLLLLSLNLYVESDILAR